MDYIKSLFEKESTRRIFVLLGICCILYLLRSVIDLFLMTFILAFLMFRLQNIVVFILRKFMRVQQRIVAIILYILLLGGIAFMIYLYLPDMISQASNLIIEVTKKFITYSEENMTLKYIAVEMKKFNILSYTEEGLNFILSSFSSVLNLAVAILLSMMFLVEKGRVKTFTMNMKNSKIHNIYNDIEFFGRKFTNSFGKIIETQVLISITNTILSIIGLYIIGFKGYVLGLTIMIFLLGLIPVAGVIISLFPLSIIAYSIGGFPSVVSVFVLIIIIHIIETYLLNPKFMSMKTNLPVFYTLLILIVSEKIMGIRGLIIGIPIFVFILDLLDINLKNGSSKG